MLGMVALAVAAGVAVSLSRALNSRLSVATSPLKASLANHVVGFLPLVALALLLGQAWPAGTGTVPPWAWAGGPLGVIFVASGAWLVRRLGAALTALMVIAGQMVSGALLDALRGAPGGIATAAGVVLILAGMALSRR